MDGKECRSERRLASRPNTKQAEGQSQPCGRRGGPYLTETSGSFAGQANSSPHTRRQAPRATFERWEDWLAAPVAVER